MNKHVLCKCAEAEVDIESLDFAKEIGIYADDDKKFSRNEDVPLVPYPYTHNKTGIIEGEFLGNNG
jgi:hypothetical protein